jgi:histidyl-tRNA synthetase
MGVFSPLADAEAIALGAHILKELGLDKSITLKLNTLGDLESRTAYQTALINYFKKYSSDLSPESQIRLEKNPLRILDSKDPGDQALVQNAPDRDSFLTSEAQDFFANVRKALESLNIPYEIDPYLVRGLDYYSHTAFEFSSSALGAQAAVLGGGRYNGLVEQLGGPPTACVGWGAGIERMMLLLEKCIPLPPHVTIISVSQEQELLALNLAQQARAKGLSVWLDFQVSMAKHMKKASKMKTPFLSFRIGLFSISSLVIFLILMPSSLINAEVGFTCLLFSLLPSTVSSSLATFIFLIIVCLFLHIFTSTFFPIGVSATIF